MKHVMTALIALFLAMGCTAESNSPDGVDLLSEEPSLLEKADGADDFQVEPRAGGFLATVYGTSAQSLWDAMEGSGLAVERRNGLDWVRAPKFACVTNRRASACQFFSSTLRELDGNTIEIVGTYDDGSAASDLAFMLADTNGERRTQFRVGVQLRAQESVGNILCVASNQPTIYCYFQPE